VRYLQFPVYTEKIDCAPSLISKYCGFPKGFNEKYKYSLYMILAILIVYIQYYKIRMIDTVLKNMVKFTHNHTY